MPYKWSEFRPNCKVLNKLMFQNGVVIQKEASLISLFVLLEIVIEISLQMQVI
jgi:hypothetical protein